MSFCKRFTDGQSDPIIGNAYTLYTGLEEKLERFLRMLKGIAFRHEFGPSGLQISHIQR